MLSFKKNFKECRSLYLPIYLPYVVHLMPSCRSRFPSDVIPLNLEVYLFMYLFACLLFWSFPSAVEVFFFSAFVVWKCLYFVVNLKGLHWSWPLLSLNIFLPLVSIDFIEKLVIMIVVSPYVVCYFSLYLWFSAFWFWCDQVWFSLYLSCLKFTELLGSVS